jgi:dihydroorotate dehydrogenase
MAFDPFPLVKPLLHRFDPETAHELTLRALELHLVPPQPPVDEPSIAIELFGRRLPSPVGLAAGFDKNARVFAQMYAQGFAFVEVGGVTPLPQTGNPRPRVFRYPAERAVINKMGFPNAGADVVARRLAATPAPGMLGVNLASNARTRDPIADFVALAERFAPLCAYLTLDISCPNTANGQEFLDPGRLRELLARVAAADLGTARPAIAAKLSPDIADDALEELIAVLLAARIDAIVVGNTTSRRDEVAASTAYPPGGLSGPPIFARSTAQLARVADLTGGTVPLIGVGGVSSGSDAYAKIRAGATAVQLYTGLIFAGTALVTRIRRELAVLLMRDGYGSLSEAVGSGRPIGGRFTA